jgi:hypothetical protein
MARLTQDERDYRDETNRHNRRMREEAAASDRMDRKERAAEALIGHLQGEKGARVYINVRDRNGRLTGAVKEWPDTRTGHLDAVAYLIRNHYV